MQITLYVHPSEGVVDDVATWPQTMRAEARAIEIDSDDLARRAYKSFSRRRPWERQWEDLGEEQRQMWLDIARSIVATMRHYAARRATG